MKTNLRSKTSANPTLQRGVLNRRNFLRASGFASASLLVPNFLRATALNQLTSDANGKVLVVIQLSGGNDGLNTVVPFSNDLYYKYRPDLGLRNEEIIKLTDDVALNQSLKGLADLYHEGYLGILNSVGYPNPNRSHFRSMEIWQTASDEDQYLSTGWIGRTLDSNCEKCSKTYSAVELDDYMSLALKGETKSGMAFRDPDSFKLFSGDTKLRDLIAQYRQPIINDNSVDFLHKTLTETVESADYLLAQSKIYQTQIAYPQTDFANQLKTIASLINARTDIMVYYVSLSGFDTHVFQKGTQSKQLEIYGNALKAFCDDLKSNDQLKNTMVITFSEFGRRVRQNASKGTDHGTANNVFIAGGNLKQAGVLNASPDLEHLDQDDLLFQTDFRSVYATVLKNWLNVDANTVMKKEFPILSFA